MSSSAAKRAESQKSDLSSILNENVRAKATKGPMKSPFKRNLSWFLQPSGSCHIKHARKEYGPGGADHAAFNEQVDYLLEAYKDPAKIADPFISEVFIGNSLRRMLDVLLRVSAERGVPFISISQRDFFGYGGAQVNQWPAAWDITKRLSFGLGCGNGPQSQIFDYFKSHPEIWGTYDTRSGEKVGPHLTLYSANRDEVDKPVPEGSLPDFEKCIYGRGSEYYGGYPQVIFG